MIKFSFFLIIAGNIRVFCRIRPPIAEDGISPYEAVLQHEYNSDVVVVENKKGRSQQFEMDRLFSHESSQIQVGLIYRLNYSSVIVLLQW